MCTSIVLLIALMVQSGLAIKCFNCDSDSNEGCVNMTDANLIAEECNDEKQIELESQFNNRNRPLLLQISDAYYRRPQKSNSDTVQMVCQKLVGVEEDGKRSVVRRCQLANVDCTYSDQQMAVKFPKALQIEACKICEDKDACNGSPNNRVFDVVIGIVAVMAAVFRHLSL